MSAPRPAVNSATQKAVPHPPLVVDGNASFSNYHLAGLVLGLPLVLIKLTPFLSFGFWTYTLYTLVFGLPITCAYWILSSVYGPNIDKDIKLPNRPQSDYFTINDPNLREQYLNRKIPMQVWHDAYFDGKIDINMDMLEVLEYRHDWALFHFNWALLKYVLFTMVPEVISHSKTQDEEQVRDHYDRGDDFYEWFLGPRMIYTSGVISDPNKDETLEQLQDNKLAIVCEKLALKPEDRLLDIGCGWGTLAAFAGKNYNCDVTGVTLARNQTKFGNDRLRKNGVSEEKGRILCNDYRELATAGKRYSKIVSLEMFEHIGVRHYQGAMREFYDLLDDDGLMFVQVSGFRVRWQFEDLMWCLTFEQIFQGADASCALSWHLAHYEAAGFEIKSVDTLGVHYAATLNKWRLNWAKNRDQATAKYGERSVIASRQYSASIFQIVMHKNLNKVHRVEGVPTHFSIHHRPDRQLSPVE